MTQPTLKQWLARKPAGRKPRKPIRKVGKKAGKELRFYFVLRKGYMRAHPVCEMPKCSKQATDLHHKAGRGPHLCDTRTFMAVCRPCHDFIHANPKEARAIGVLQ